MPQIPVPDDFKTQVSTKNKQIDLSDKHLDAVTKNMKDDDKIFIRSLLYNYYDNYYGLKICNAKISSVSQFIDFYNNIALQG